MNIQDSIKILEEEIAKLSAEKMTNNVAQLLCSYYGAKTALESRLTKPKINDIIPIENDGEYISSWQEYSNNHTEHNLKKVCLEIQELCMAVYSTLQNEQEKSIYKNMLDALWK